MIEFRFASVTGTTGATMVGAAGEKRDELTPLDGELDDRPGREPSAVVSGDHMSGAPLLSQVRR